MRSHLFFSILPLLLLLVPPYNAQSSHGKIRKKLKNLWSEGNGTCPFDVFSFSRIQYVVGSKPTNCSVEEVYGIAETLQNYTSYTLIDIFTEDPQQESGTSVDNVTVMDVETSVCINPDDLSFDLAGQRRLGRRGQFLYQGGFRCRFCGTDDTDNRRILKACKPSHKVIVNQTFSDDVTSHGWSSQKVSQIQTTTPWYNEHIGKYLGPLGPGENTSKTFDFPSGIDEVKIGFNFIEVGELWNDTRKDRLNLWINKEIITIAKISSRVGITTGASSNIKWAMYSPKRLGQKDRTHKILLHIGRAVYSIGREKKQNQVKLTIRAMGNNQAGIDNVQVFTSRSCLESTTGSQKERTITNKKSGRPENWRLRQRRRRRSRKKGGGKNLIKGEGRKESKKRSKAVPPRQKDQAPDDPPIKTEIWILEQFEKAAEKLLSNRLSRMIQSYHTVEGHCYFGKSPQVTVNLMAKTAWYEAQPRCYNQGNTQDIDPLPIN